MPVPPVISALLPFKSNRSTRSFVIARATRAIPKESTCRNARSMNCRNGFGGRSLDRYGSASKDVQQPRPGGPVRRAVGS